MNQGTRIVVALLVVLIIVTGVYWLMAGPKKPGATGADPALAPPVAPAGASGDAARRGATPTAGTGSGLGGRPATGSGDRPGTGGGGTPNAGRTSSGRDSTTPPSSGRLELGGGNAPGGGPLGSGGAGTGLPANGGASAAGGSRPASDVGGKGDMPDVPNFSRRPVGPMPSLANMPAGFVPADGARAIPTSGTSSAPAATTGGGAAPSTPPNAAGPAPARPSTPVSPPPATNPPAAASAPPSAAVMVDEYIVQEGDTLTTIADMWFGDGRKWPLILAANEGVDPARLRIGQKIKMPDRGAKAASTKAPPAGPAGQPGGTTGRPGSAAPSSDATSHVVAEGDTLYSIARARLGDGQRWEEIYQANRALIGADPKALKVGTRLVMPAKGRE